MEFNNQSQYQYPYPDGRRRRRGLGGFGITVIVLVFVLVVLLALVIALRGGGAYDPEVSTATPTPEAGLPGATEPPVSVATPLPGGHEMPALDGVPPDLADVPQFFLNNPIPDIFDAVSDSVVGVVNYTTQRIGERRMLAIYGSGSGFIVSSEGYILTNAHVIEDAEEITVLLANGEEVEAALIGFDEETDVAVLKVEHEGLVPMALGDSDAVRVGEFVVAIGNPLDTSSLANTTTFGVISAHAREITIDGHTNTYLQTDAAINFGNSGGPLVNQAGQVVGINTFIKLDGESYRQSSIAVVSSAVARLLQQWKIPYLEARPAEAAPQPSGDDRKADAKTDAKGTSTDARPPAAPAAPKESRTAPAGV